MAFQPGNIVKNVTTVNGEVIPYDPSKHPEGGPEGVSGPPGAKHHETVEIPPGFTGEVLSSDDLVTVAIYPIHSTTYLEPMLIKVEDFTSSFKRAVRHNPFIWQKQRDLKDPGRPLDFESHLRSAAIEDEIDKAWRNLVSHPMIAWMDPDRPDHLNGEMFSQVAIMWVFDPERSIFMLGRRDHQIGHGYLVQEYDEKIGGPRKGYPQYDDNLFFQYSLPRGEIGILGRQGQIGFYNDPLWDDLDEGVAEAAAHKLNELFQKSGFIMKEPTNGFPSFGEYAALAKEAQAYDKFNYGSILKRGHWLDGYHGAVIHKGNLYVARSEADFHSDAYPGQSDELWEEDNGNNSYRGLYNPTTQDLLHMSTWGDDDQIVGELGVESDVAPKLEKLKEIWLNAAQRSGISVKSFGAYVIDDINFDVDGFAATNPKTYEVFEADFQSSIENDRKGERWPEVPYKILREQPKQLTLFSHLRKQSHWLDGYYGASLGVDSHGKLIIEIANNEADFHPQTRGRIARGLYNSKTQDLLHMASPQEQSYAYANLEMAAKEDVVPYYDNWLEDWLKGAKNSGIPVKSFGLYVFNGKNLRYKDGRPAPDGYSVNPIELENFGGFKNSIESQMRNNGAIVDPFEIVRQRQPGEEWDDDQLQLFAALEKQNDPLDLSGLQQVIESQEVPWWTYPREQREQAVANSLRVAILSPLKLLKFNAVHYQDITHIPADETNLEVYLDALVTAKEEWDRHGQIDMFSPDPEEIPPFDPKNPEKYAGFIHKHLKYIIRVSQHIEELTDAAEEDIMAGGRGYIWRDKLRELKLPGVNSKVAAFSWLLLAPKTSDLATIDSHILRALEADERMSQRSDAYEVLENEMRAAKDFLGYKDLPLGQFQWGLWDVLRTPPDDKGYRHQDHGAMRVLDPTPYNEINWHQPVNNSWMRSTYPDWWLATKEVRDPIRMEYELSRPPRARKKKEVEDELKLFAALKRKLTST